MRRAIVFCSCVLVLLLAAPAASAQGQRRERPGRPSREVVGLRVVFGSNADDNGADDAARPPQFRGTQVSSVVQSTLTIAAVQREKLQLKFDGTSGVQHYASLHRALGTGHGATGVMSFQIDRGTSITLSQSVAYAPNFSMAGSYAPPEDIAGSMAPDAATVPTLAFSDVSITRQPTMNLSSSAGLNRTLGRRGALSLGWDLKQTEFIDSSEANVEAANARGMFTYRLFGGVGIRAGYGRRLGSFGAAASRKLSIDDATLGLDFNQGRSISLGQRAVLSFASGSSIISDQGRRQYVVTGTSALNYTLPGGGLARLGYDRNVRLVGGFTEPVLVDTTSGNIGMKLGSRVLVAAIGAYSHGALGPRGDADTHYEIWSGSAQIGMAIGGSAAMFLSYSHYEQHTGWRVASSAGGSPTQTRDTLRAGMTLGVPLIRHQLRPRRP